MLRTLYVEKILESYLGGQFGESEARVGRGIVWRSATVREPLASSRESGTNFTEWTRMKRRFEKWAREACQRWLALRFSSQSVRQGFGQHTARTVRETNFPTVYLIRTETVCRNPE